MRNEDDHVLEAIDEAIAVARGANCALQISHLKTQGPRNWGKLDDAFARVAAARATGCDAAFDRYPYIAYQTGLTNLFPVWSRDGSNEAFLGRLGDPATADRIRTETLAKVELIGGWGNVMIANVSNPADRPVEGQRLDAYARRNTRTVRHGRRAAPAKPRKRRHGRVRDERRQPRAHSGASARNGVQRRRRVRRRRTVAPWASASARARRSPRVLGRYVRERKALTPSRRSTR
jgi:N-acyl-D-amino-acid deacylase